jgi:hypothetical protein
MSACDPFLSSSRYGPESVVVENPVATGGLVHANCAGHPGSVSAFLHSAVVASGTSEGSSGPSSGSA